MCADYIRVPRQSIPVKHRGKNQKSCVVHMLAYSGFIVVLCCICITVCSGLGSKSLFGVNTLLNCTYTTLRSGFGSTLFGARLYQEGLAVCIWYVYLYVVVLFSIYIWWF